MKLFLLGWKSQGLRCPDCDISLERNGGVFGVSFIQMPNGTGKTTTLTLLRSALSGVGQHWDRSVINSFKSHDYETERGLFIVQLRADNQRVTIELHFDFVASKIRYRTSYGSGIEEGWAPPSYMRQFLNEQFINLFIFDGELAQALLDSKKTKAMEALKSLFQLYLLTDIQRTLDDHWLEHRGNVSATEETGLTRRKNKYHELMAKLEGLREERDKIASRADQFEEEVDRLEQKYREGLLAEEVEKGELTGILENFSNAAKEVETYALQTIEFIRDPHSLSTFFYDRLNDLKANLDKLKLPRTSSKEFFQELADPRNLYCICGTMLDEAKRQRIIETSEDYLAEDETGVLNSIKSDIGQMCCLGPATYVDNAATVINQLNKAVSLRDIYAAEKIMFEESLTKTGGVELQRAKEHLASKRQELNTMIDRLSELNRDPEPGDDENDCDCIKFIEKSVKEAEKKLAEITNTVVLKNKINIIKDILQKADEKAMSSIKATITKETNDKMNRLLPLEPVRIEKIEQCLKLQNRDHASVGQTLALAYGFLSTIFSRDNHSLPFIVDSPAGPLDHTVRKQVARLIPDLSHQFVAFTISSERAGFIEPLEDKLKTTPEGDSSKEIQYLTIFRKNANTEHLCKTMPSSNVRNIGSSVLVEGRDFYNSFDVEKETNNVL